MKPNNLLRRERELRGWSQARVAEEIGTTALNVGRWERGMSMPYPHFREKLCVLFGKDAVALGLVDVEDASAEESVVAGDKVSGGTVSTPAMYDPAIPVLSAGKAHLVGREELLVRLKQRLCGEEQPAIVALNGLPGVGKTALAMKLAYDAEVREFFQDGILWAGLGPQPDVMDLLGRWGRLLAIPAATAGKLETSEAWAKAVRAALGQRQMLLVIDDAWQIEDALAFQVGGPHCSYLVTTRYPHLAVQLAAHGAFGIPELTKQDGLALLARYAGEFVQQSPEEAQFLVHSVGALPLALTLMGKYLSVQEYSGQPRRLQAAVDRLRDARARLQLSETRALAERHPSIVGGTTFSLQTVIAVSEQPLDEPARAALHALSVFPAKPNCFSEEAALEVCQAPVEMLDKLCDAGLVESNGPDRYMLHQMIADYGRDALKDTTVSKRLIDYYVHFAEENRSNHALLETEVSNILAALDAAYAAHHWAELVRGACALAEFLRARGLFSVAEKHVRRAYEAAKMLGDTSSMVDTLLYLGPIELSWGNIVPAKAYLLESLQLARQTNNEEQISGALRHLAEFEEEQGNFAQTEAYLGESLVLARKFGQQESICALLTSLGILAGKRGNLSQSRSYLREGLALARQEGFRDHVTILILDLGRVEYERGNYRRSEVSYREAINRAENFGYPVVHGVGRIYLGALLMRQGRMEQSQEVLQKALTVLRQVGHHLWLGQALFELGVLATLEGDDHQAEEFFQKSFESAQRTNDRETMGFVFSERGKLEVRRGNFQQAEHYLRDALQIGRDLGLYYLICSTLSVWGEIHLQHQRLDEAERCAQEMQAAVPEDQRELRAMSFYAQARLAVAQGNTPEALRKGQASLAIFSTIGHYRAHEVEQWLTSEHLLS